MRKLKEKKIHKTAGIHRMTASPGLESVSTCTFVDMNKKSVAINDSLL